MLGVLSRPPRSGVVRFRCRALPSTDTSVATTGRPEESSSLREFPGASSKSKSSRVERCDVRQGLLKRPFEQIPEPAVPVSPVKFLQPVGAVVVGRRSVSSTCCLWLDR